MPLRFPSHARRLVTRSLRRLLWASLLLGAGSCDGVRWGDTLDQDLPPAEAAACRQAVAAELTQQGVNPERVRRIYYRRVTPRQKGAIGRNPGYRAWVYPRLGRQVMIIDLSGSCQVRGVRLHGPERGEGGSGGM